MVVQMRVKHKDLPKLKWHTEDIMQMSYKVRASPCITFHRSRALASVTNAAPHGDVL